MATNVEVQGPNEPDPDGAGRTEKRTETIAAPVMAPKEYAQPSTKPADIVSGGGSLAEGVVGAGASVLAILGLTGVRPFYMAAIAVIAIGVALLLQGGSLAARYTKVLRETSEGRVRGSEVGGGMSAETIAGLAGVALGILALLGVLPMLLMPIAIIVFGGGLLIGSGATARLNDAVLDWRTTNDSTRRVAREAASASAGAQFLVGVSALVLGVLALLGVEPLALTLVALLGLGVEPLALTLVALLGLGVSVLMNGSTMGARMLGFLHH